MLAIIAILILGGLIGYFVGAGFESYAFLRFCQKIANWKSPFSPQVNAGLITGSFILVGGYLTWQYGIKAKDREAACTWYEDQYITGGVDKLIEAIWVGKTFGVQPSYSDIRIPIEATHRVATLIHSETLVMLIMFCHPKWQERIYGNDLATFNDHAKVTEVALLELRAALIPFPIKRKSDIGRIHNNFKVKCAVETINKSHKAINKYAEDKGKGSITLREIDRTLHYLPTAWDWRFDQKKGPMLITLNDGTQIGGYFGENSCVSTDPSERDLYLEPMYDIIDGMLQTAASYRGILIKASAIKHIQFYPNQSKKEEQGKSHDRRRRTQRPTA